MMNNDGKASERAIMEQIERQQNEKLREAVQNNLYHGLSAIDRQAIAEGEAIAALQGYTRGLADPKREGTRQHGRAARPTSGSGSGRYALERLHKVSRERLKAALSAAATKAA